jgi:uncharacterized peroxidase-related enzyme
MDTRRYELATLAAARQLRSTYCALAHGTLLRDRFYDAETLVRIAADHRDADLDRVDIAVMDLAVKVARDGTAVTATDFAELRGCGLADVEIFKIVLAAARPVFLQHRDRRGAGRARPAVPDEP